MTKLNEVIRGVEERSLRLPEGESEPCVYNLGYNSLANAEVVVDREELTGITAQGYCTDRNGHKVLDPDLLEDIAKAIATAIENGSIIRLKEE